MQGSLQFMVVGLTQRRSAFGVIRDPIQLFYTHINPAA
jgi:hypothetical protein